MKIPGLLLLVCVAELYAQALYFKDGESLNPVLLTEQDAEEVTRHSRQTAMDQTVRSLLEWLQGRYTQMSKKAVRDSDTAQSAPSRTYLPIPDDGGQTVQIPQERPRPFQPPSNNVQPPQYQPPPYQPPYQPPSSVAPPSSGYPYQPPPSVAPPQYQPPPSVGPPSSGYPSYKPQPSPVAPYEPPSSPAPPTGYPSYKPQPSPVAPYQPPSSPAPPAGYPYPPSPQPPFTTTTTTTESPTYPPSKPTPDITTSEGSDVNNLPEGSHPPHIHEITVLCSKDQMDINIEFDRVFNGVIYSKGYYKDNACQYVRQNSGKVKYSFTVRLDTCGTQFINQFKEGGQAYLENILVLQNEPGIQEAWDTVRRVRCLWEGTINQALTVGLNVDMLSQELVTFSGDTATARLEIQMGRGPFAPQASGLVKIGETMTLVVIVEGDPDFDIQVRECIARDSTRQNVVRLTDDRGCVLRPKLMGAFQRTKNTQSSSTAVIAYAFFQAFKFPDVMDLTFECNVELCKTDCQTCPQGAQPLEPQVRRRRDVRADNSTLGEPVRIVHSFRVIAPEDIDDASSLAAATVINVGAGADGICMSLPGFLLGMLLLLTVLVASCLLSAYLYLQQQRTQKL